MMTVHLPEKETVVVPSPSPWISEHFMSGDPRTHRSTCACGWKGPMRLGNPHQAWLDRCDHLGSALVESEWLDTMLAQEFADGANLIGEKVIRLAQVNAVLARANGRAEERRWLDLIHALEADLLRFRPEKREEPVAPQHYREAVERVLELAKSWDDWPTNNFAEDVRAAVEGREPVHRK